MNYRQLSISSLTSRAGLARPGRIEVLETRADLEAYAERFTRAGGGSVSLEHLEASTVYACRNAEGGIVGGFVVSSGRALKVYAVMGEARFAAAAAERGARPEDFAEINCFWMNRKRINAGDRARLYLAMGGASVASGKRFILGGTVVPQLRDAYRWILPRVLFEGEVEFKGQTRPAWAFYCEASLMRYTTATFLTQEFVRGWVRSLFRVPARLRLSSKRGS